MSEWGEWLPGGNVGGAWRVGDTVRRITGPWSPAVHALLEHLRGRLDGVPAFHGVDEHGREILDYLPGRVVDVDTEELTDRQLVAVAAWTRRLHQETADFHHRGPWRNFPPQNPTLIGHGDIAPYNLCFDGDELVGVFDWDMAGPTTHWALPPGGWMKTQTGSRTLRCSEDVADIPAYLSQNGPGDRRGTSSCTFDPGPHPIGALLTLPGAA